MKTGMRKFRELAWMFLLAVVLAVAAAPETVRAEEEEALPLEEEGVTGTLTGTLGENNGLSWEYDAETKTLTVSGEGSTFGTFSSGGFHSLIEDPYGIEIQKVVFQGCKMKYSGNNLFRGMTSLESVDLSGLDTSGMTWMRSMFAGCSSLTSLDVSGFDTSSVIDMCGMFAGCSGLTSLDVNGWNTSSVTDMGDMFFGCSSLTSLDVSKWDTSSVTNMSFMFWKCSSLTSLDTSKWNTSSVTRMHEMFNDCSSLTSLDVSGWNTSGVTYMYKIFFNCSGLTSLDVSGWNTSNVTDMEQMFFGCSGLKSLDVSNFKTSNVTSMVFMFCDCSGLTSLDVSNFNTSSVTAMQGMFRKCSSLTNLDVSNFDTSSVTDMISMFSGCSGLTSLNVSKWNTSSVTWMDHMFSGCSSLTSLDVSGWNTSSVTGMDHMFSGCSGLTSLNVSGWDTDNVTAMGSMFSGCSGLTSLDVSGFDTSSVTEMPDMFSGCSGLTSLDVSGFDTSSVTEMPGMFYGCSSLTGLDLSSFDADSVTDMYKMFVKCSNLTWLQTPLHLNGSIELPITDPGDVWYQEDGTVVMELPQGKEQSVLLTKNGTFSVYTVNFDLKGVGVSMAPRKVKEKSKLTVPRKPRAAGKVFLGWYKDEDYNTEWDFDNDTVNGETTLYAKWGDATTYNIIYKDGEETLSLEPVTYMEGSAAVSLPVPPAREGYLFRGWHENSDLSDEAVTAIPADSEGDKTFYAAWARVYTVTFDMKGHGTAIGAVKVAEGDKVPSRGNPTASGYVFLGWCRDEDCSTAWDFENDKVTGNITLYAKWRELQKYTVTYMDGTTPMTGLTPIEYREGNTALNLPTSAEKPGYIFKGWYDNQGLTGTAVTLIPANSTESKTYYAKWAKICKINYLDGDTPLENLTPSTFEEGTEPELAKDAKKGGYFFGGWYTDKECKGEAVTKVPAGSNADLTYYAKWNAGIKVSFDLQGHGTAIDAVTLEKDSKVSKPADPTAEGFTFGGWYKEAACTTAWDFDKDTVSADTTLYAKWTPLTKNYIVTFHTNGAAEIAAQTIEEGKTATEPKAPTKAGYHFGGWYMDAACTAKYDFATAVAADVTLYAKWLDASGLKIYFVDENGTTLSSYTSVYTGSAIAPNVQVMYNGEVLTSEEYSLAYANNTKVGTADDAKGPSVTVKGKGRFTGTYRMGFTIQPASLTMLEYAASTKVVKGQKAIPVISCNGMALKESDYTVEPGVSTKWETNGTMTVTGKGNFKDSIKINVEVVEQSAQKSIAVTVSKAKLTYNGKAQTPELKVTEKGVKNGTPLTLGKDYVVYTSGKAINAGSYSVTVVGIGDYTGSLTKKYTISPLKLSKEDISASYSGTVLHNVNGATLGSLLKVTGKTSAGSMTLQDGVDYTISYSNNKKAGTGKYTLNFKGNYKGTKAYKGTFTIAPLSMEKAEVNVVAADKTGYTKPGVFKVTPVVTVNGMLLKSSDYTVQYYTDKECTKEMSKNNPVTIEGDNKYAEVYMKLTSKGSNYTGSVLKGSYKVYKKNAAPNDLSKAKVKLSLTADNTSYSGKELTPAVASVEIGKGKNAASVSTDCYEVTYINNVNPGTAKVMIRGLEEKGYYGCKTVTFKIKSFSLANLVKLLLSGK